MTAAEFERDMKAAIRPVRQRESTLHLIVVVCLCILIGGVLGWYSEAILGAIDRMDAVERVQ